MTHPSDEDPTLQLGARPTPASTAPSVHGFRTGTVWAERYRLIAELGAGGMGKVFRTEDLELREEVAIKFLNVASNADPAKVDLLRGEVRTARLVTHPNVCRVHDFGDVDGQTFLTMEYVDGEDLGSLMRRIGKLPKEKALQIAMQIASGLNAAHERGVIHRDLKPGNVMIDSEGEVRLTDFGLAASLESLREGHSIAGTPAYMAPELFAGAAPSVGSDMYSLGVLLFELFAGKRPFDGDSIESLLASHRSPERPSLLVHAPSVDPELAQIISRCLSLDPRRRPASAVEVLAALPGWNPLRDSIARGETPSPLMVAASRGAGTVAPRRANLILASVLLGIGLVYALVSRESLVARMPVELPGSVLAEDARRMLDDLGYPRREEGVDTFEVWAFDAYEKLIDEMLRDESLDRWAALDRRRPSPLDFYFRRSPEPIVPTTGSLKLGWDEPPVRTPGMVQVRLDLLGGLRELRAVPESYVQAGAANPPGARTLDWSRIFEHADLDIEQFEVTRPRLRPAHFATERFAWIGVYPENDQPIRVEAASLGERLVAFRILEVDTDGQPLSGTLPSKLEYREDTSRAGRNWVFDGFALVIGLSAILFAWNSITRRRTDFKGANRCAVFLFVLVSASNFLMAHHVADLAAEIRIIVNALARGLLKTAFFWVLYVGYEPHVRRIWPELLVSWTRVFQRRGRDPLVWSHVMAGIGIGTLVALLQACTRPLGEALGAPTLEPLNQDMATAMALDGPTQTVGAILHLAFRYFGFGINSLMMLVLFRLIFRRASIAIGFGIIVVTFIFYVGDGSAAPYLLPIALIQAAIIVLSNVRYGLLGAAVGSTTFGVFMGIPATLDLGAWYVGSGILVLGILAGVSVFAWRQIRSCDHRNPITP